jgi:hypothetical protein
MRGYDTGTVPVLPYSFSGVFHCVKVLSYCSR